MRIVPSAPRCDSLGRGERAPLVRSPHLPNLGLPVVKAPSPLLGFNNNVRHKGRLFHIQTEDSGIRHPHIITHLFADGGRILKTTKTSYAEHVGQATLAETVRGMMKEQHKAMFTSLRSGAFDPLLEKALGPLSEAPPRPSGVISAAAVPPPAPQPAPPVEPPRSRSPEAEAEDGSHRLRALSNPNLQAVRPSVAPPSSDALDQAVASSLDKIPSARPPKGPARNSTPPRSRKSNPVPGRKRNSVAPANRAPAVPQRPSAQFAAAPPPSARSIFGDGVGEKSLDEVILSYLAEDLEGGQDT